VNRGDLPLLDEPGQVPRVPVTARAGHDDGGAADQRPEELPHRDVEAGGRLLQHAVIAPRPYRACIHSSRLTTLAWLMSTPLGRPVVPEV